MQNRASKRLQNRRIADHKATKVWCERLQRFSGADVFADLMVAGADFGVRILKPTSHKKTATKKKTPNKSSPQIQSKKPLLTAPHHSLSGKTHPNAPRNLQRSELV